jgi:acyl dehydratase
MPAERFRALARHRFPGGSYRVAHWENWLLTDCTGRDPMPGDLVHPIVLFHAPILGAGTSVGELFRLAEVSGAGGSVALLGYDWEYHQPLREDLDYLVDGGIVSAERHTLSSGAVHDDLAFSIGLSFRGEAVARITNRWRFRRRSFGEPSHHRAPPAPDPAPGPAVVAGTEIPAWEVASVDAARMKTMAAILRDPYPVHWDREANAALGLRGRVVNQGPLNLGYIANMLMAWAGPASVRRLTVTFGPPVLDGDHVVARGRVVEVTGGIAVCAVALVRDGDAVVTGTAEVVAPG